MNWKRASGRRYARLGVVVSRRVGGAVLRSRARRVMREAFRAVQSQLSDPVDLVLVARKQIVVAHQSTITKELVRLLKQAHLIECPS